MTPNSTSNEKSVIREPLLAGILSYLFMGLGQAYNGQRRKGYMFFASYILLGIFYLILLNLFNEPFPKGDEKIKYTSPSYIITVICGIIIWLFNIYNAYQSAKRINDGSILVDSSPGKSSFIFLRTIFLWFISIIGLFIGLMLILVIFGSFITKR